MLAVSSSLMNADDHYSHYQDDLSAVTERLHIASPEDWYFIPKSHVTAINKKLMAKYPIFLI